MNNNQSAVFEGKNSMFMKQIMKTTLAAISIYCATTRMGFPSGLTGQALLRVQQPLVILLMLLTSWTATSQTPEAPFTVYPQDMEVQCCEPAEFYCAGHGKYVNWLIKRESDESFWDIDWTNSPVYRFTSKTEHQIDNDNVESHMNVFDYDESFENTAVRCKLIDLHPLRQTDSPIVYLTVLPGIGKVQNFKFDPVHALLTWKEPPVVGLEVDGVTYNVTVTDTFTESQVVHEETEETSLNTGQESVPCREYLAQVTALATDTLNNTVAGLTASRCGVAEGNYYELGDLNLSSTAACGHSVLVPLNLPPSALPTCPQQLVVDMGADRYELDAGTFDNENSKVVPVGITLRANQTNYTVSASVLDEAGNVEDSTAAVFSITPQPSAAIPDNSLTITVSAQDGTGTRTRTIIFTPTSNPDHAGAIAGSFAGGAVFGALTTIALTAVTVGIYYGIQKMKRPTADYHHIQLNGMSAL